MNTLSDLADDVLTLVAEATGFNAELQTLANHYVTVRLNIRNGLFLGVTYYPEEKTYAMGYCNSWGMATGSTDLRLEETNDRELMRRRITLATALLLTK